VIRGIIALTFLTAAILFLTAAMINYHDPDPARPFLMTVASFGFSIATILTARRAVRPRGRA
jgi:hypothetical protein